MDNALIQRLVYEGNMQLPKNQLVKLTWGNVSMIDRVKKVICIKPSGIPYKKLSPVDMVITDLDGNVYQDQLKPSSDLSTHVYLYKHFPKVNSIVHTHSLHAVVFAQAGKAIQPYGTTHADTFYGPIPCARNLTQQEVEQNYELNTGKVIVETYQSQNITPDAIPAINTKNHGPFIFGTSVKQAIEHTIVLEEVAEMALKTELLAQQNIPPIDQFLLDKHYYRKHGKNAYYGQ
ncbi:L-ribulose-5-phosphate 4-epimerase AraD [Staphylococcus durrellii]|uniref:L-ribulose-5-phosphate 4-epimerase AraD n=1 Tax=Staphylococcus durrellii TaxID=2781773 RepID=UPI002E2AAE18|nr:L-ribulose-5-phosphate 4-epimerase AraD [Staphylococcus durrellii]